MKMFENSIRCLILFESFRKEGTKKIPVSISSARVYALVAEEHKEQLQGLFDGFAKCNIRIPEKHQDTTVFQNPPNNITFEIFEFEYNPFPGTPEELRKVWYSMIQVDDINRSIMNALFHRLGRCYRDLSRDIGNNDYLTVLNENVGFIEKWLSHGAEIIYRHRKRETLLHFAVRMDSESLVSTLLRCNYEVDALRSDGLSPLHIAAKRGHLGIVLLLTSHGASTSLRVENYRGITPLMLAAKKGHLDIVRALIDFGIDINAVRRPDSWSCLHLAAYYGHSEVVETCIQHGADIHAKTTEGPSEGPTSLILAIEGNELKVAEALLKAGANVNETCDTLDGRKMSVLQASLEDLTMLELILSFHPDPSLPYNQVAFFTAVAYPDEIFKKSVELLCQNGFSIRNEILDGLTERPALEFLFAAIAKNCHSVVKAILNKYDIVHLPIRPNLPDFQFNCTPLHLAAARCDENMLKLLTEYGAVINSPDEDGKKPLFYAVSIGSIDAIGFLIKHKAIEAEPNQPELLYAAIHRGDSDIVETLLLHGVRVNGRHEGEKLQLPILVTTTEPASGESNPPRPTYVSITFEDHALRPEWRQPPICYAASLGNTQVVKVLLKFGTFNNIYNAHYRNGPLMRAAENMHFEAFRILLYDNFPKTDPSCGIKTVFVRSRIGHPLEYRQAVAHYLIKIKGCGLQVCTNRLSDIWNFPYTVEQYQSDCEKEVDELKNEKVGNTSVSYFDILMKDVKAIARYARNENVVRALENGEYVQRFPIYGDLIKSRFLKGCHRRFLMDRGINTLCGLIEHFPNLPYNLKEDIANYLDNLDLLFMRPVPS